MPNLNINTIALVSTLRPAPFKGAPSSEDFNDSQNETLLDLTSISAFVNNVLIPMLQALPDVALTGLEGSSIYGDSTDQTSLFYDSNTSESLSIADGMRQLNATLASNSTAVSNLSIQVGQLQQTLSSTNQNDIATSLQNLTNSVTTLTNAQTTTDAEIQEFKNIQTNTVAVSTGISSFTMLDTVTGNPYLVNLQNGVLVATLIS
ncbi:MAG: hypothetical protein ACRYGG_23775 [Janthinobacterium lividum]